MNRLHRNKRARALLCVTSVGVSFFLVSMGTAKGQCDDAYILSKSTLDGGGVTFATGSVYRLGATAGQHDAGILSGMSYDLTGGFWSPRTVFPLSSVIPDPSGGKNRFLSFTVPPPATATGSGKQTAIRITLVDLQHPVPPNSPQYPPPDFSGFEVGTCGDPSGCARWVGKLGIFLESQDTPGLGSYKAARLQCTPFYHDFAAEGLIHVTGAEFVPSSRYAVRVYAAGCQGNEGTCAVVSAPVTICTRRYGDVEEPYNPPSTTNQPNAIDIAQVVNHFKRLPGAPIKARVQVQPNLPELNASVNALDIASVVDAVKGFAYAFSGPCPCPSAVTCGGSCTGCTGMCVKTCTGGDNDGEPCINNNHCPSGACSAVGTCRDQCGRCN